MRAPSRWLGAGLAQGSGPAPAVDASEIDPTATIEAGCGCSAGAGVSPLWPALALTFAGLRRRRR